MKTTMWTAAAVILAMSGAAMAGEMSGSGGGSNPASEKGVKTPKQPNETQPGMGAGAGDMKGEHKGAKGKSASKGDGMSGGSAMKSGSSSMSGMSGSSSNSGNPAESKGSKTPSQPNETQPGMGSNKK